MAIIAFPGRPKVFPVRPADWIDRTTLDPEAALGDASPLGRLYGYWLAIKRETGIMPPRKAIDPIVLHDCNLMGYAHVVDVSADDPNEFTFRIFGSNVTLDSGKNFAGTKVGDYPVPQYRDAVANDYLTVKMTAWPRLQRVRASINFSRRSYQRLILPFSGSDGKTERLLVAVLYEPFDLPA
ncbi:MAG TPA: PAS domain-containing protein [Candidatus Sulfotelmatobacter sp.]|nr:PAS domain-containing protein [Candidatus Sulfotelmatobacter sp.]